MHMKVYCYLVLVHHVGALAKTEMVSIPSKFGSIPLLFTMYKF